MGGLFCSCDTGNPNLGQPGCIDAFSRDARLIFMLIKADDGTFNEIAESDLVAGILPDAFISSKINEADDSKKWAITEILKTPTPEREDPVTQDIDGVPQIVRQGNLNYSAMFFGGIASPRYEKQLNGYSCKEVGFLSVDVFGNIKGKLVFDSVAGEYKLRPRRIEPNTLNATYKEPTAEAVQQIAIRFTVSQTEIDGDLNFLPADKIETDMLEVDGVLDVVGTASNPTTTTVDVDLAYVYGPAFNFLPHLGVELADIALYNVTDDLAVIPSSVDDNGDGNYTITYPLQDSTDTMRISLSQTGYEMEPVEFIVP